MKQNILYFFLLLATLGLSAQHSVSGNFTPPEEFKWLIVYELTAGSQRYVADAAIKDGFFNITLPENAGAGMYRFVYAVPQDEFYIDVLYNGTEDVEFNFNLEDDVNFIASVENITYRSYLSETWAATQELTDFYKSEKTSKNDFTAIAQKLSEVQSKYEDMREIPLANELIRANEPYIPLTYESLESYHLNKKKAYFTFVNFENKLLQSSGFIADKSLDYVFSALPPAIAEKGVLENAVLDNVKEVSKRLLGTPENFQTGLFHRLWKTANANELFVVTDSIFENFLQPMAAQSGQQDLIDEIEQTSRLRLGAISPDITWQENDKTVTLSKISGAEHYVLVFWSSTCSHCLKELPLLHRELKSYTNSVIVAVGLEEDTANWGEEIKKLPNFKHAIALGKWESDYAELFGIKQTPTYFILDKDKRFIAKPADDKEVVSFLKERNSKK